MKKLILASASPRRHDLLERAKINFEVIPSQISEDTTQTAPEKIVAELSRRKAQDVFLHHPSDIVLGADTIVALKGEIFGKPSNEEEALEMLQRLRENTHQVYTGCAFIYANREGLVQVVTHVERTDVHIGTATDEELRAYIAGGEPMDKAGGYGIQGEFSAYVRKINGDYFNVVGLPVYYVSHQLKKIRADIGEQE